MTKSKPAKLAMLTLAALSISAMALTPAPVNAQNSGQSKEARVSNPTYWPPALNNCYPDMELLDQDGKKVRLSSFKGKVIIVEPIGMSCPACQAFTGANQKNLRPFGNVSPQPGLKSIEELLPTYGGVNLSDPRIVLVQLVLYNPSLKAPSLQEVQAWARNFGLYTTRNRYVLVGRANMVNKYSYNMIPGFQLVDKNFVLRSDSTGHNPRNNLYTHLLPMVKKLL